MVIFFFSLSTFIWNLSQFISQKNPSPTYNGQFVFFCLKNTFKNVSLHRGNKIALEALSIGNSFTQTSSGIHWMRYSKYPSKPYAHPKLSLIKFTVHLQRFFCQNNASIKTGINKIGPALYLYKDLKVLSLMQAEHLERILWRFGTLSIQT